MKKVFVAIAFVATATATWAACTTHTVMSGGRIVTCTTCCVGNNCTTNCF